MLEKVLVAIIKTSVDCLLHQGLTFSSIFPILGTVSGTGTALIVYAGGMSVIAGAITGGSLYLFIESINLFWFSLIRIAWFCSQFQLGLAASERVFAFIDAEPRITTPWKKWND
jgi:ATP-binding cassette subfamily B protein